jgi:DNA repair ATPase RecN
MADEIMQKLQEHSQKFVEHGKRFDEHDKRFDQLDKQVEFIVLKVSEHDKRLDIITDKLLEHDDRLDRIEKNMATKSDINKIMDTLDVLVGLHKKTDQEVTFLGNRVERLEEKHESDVAQLRQALTALA